MSAYGSDLWKHILAHLTVVRLVTSEYPHIYLVVCERKQFRPPLKQDAIDMLKPLWQFLVGTLPERNEPRRMSYTKALEKLLLMSTAGAFFFALARNLPGHLQEFRWPPDWKFTFDRVLRYLYLIWLLAYFFVSSVNRDLSDTTRRARDYFFEFSQSFLALAAAYFMGFVVPGERDRLTALVVANGCIVVICSLSLLCFRKDKPEDLSRHLNRLRRLGFVLSGAALILLLCVGTGFVVLSVLLVFQFLLYVLWYAFLRLRLDSVDPADPAVAPAASNS